MYYKQYMDFEKYDEITLTFIVSGCIIDTYSNRGTEQKTNFKTKRRNEK